MEQRISRTEATNLICAKGYKFYTVTWITRGGYEKTINCSSKKDCITRLGYIRAKVSRGGYKSVDPRTISRLVMGGVTYLVH